MVATNVVRLALISVAVMLFVQSGWAQEGPHSDHESTGELEYSVQGSGEPVLLIHGSYIEDALVPVMDDPSLEEYRLIHYHRRGYGGSDLHDGAFSFEQEAADALTPEAIHVRPQPEEYLEALTEAALSMPTNAAAMSVANFILMGPTDLGPALESVDRPVLAVYSSLDWAIDAAEEVREVWPELRVEILDETSHALFVDRPEAFNRVLEAFVSTLDEE